MASNNARKKAAKLYQEQHPGISYPEALRIVSRSGDLHPLTATIGCDASSKVVRLTLEEPSLGGFGPHCGISGATGTGKTHLLSVMARSLVQSPPTRGVELMYVGRNAERAPFDGVEHCISHEQLDRCIADLLADRQGQLKSLGLPDWHGAELPAAVVMVDGLGWPSQQAAVELVLRTGRALDVHLVVTTTTETPPALASNMSSLIHLNRGQPGQGTLQQPCHQGSPVSTDIRIPL